MFAGKKSAQIREILISESAWEEMTCLFAPSLGESLYTNYQYEGVFVLSPAGETRYSVIEGNLVSQPFEKWLNRNITKELFNDLSQSQGKAVSRLMMTNGQLTLLAAARITSGDDESITPVAEDASVLIFADVLTPVKLEKMGNEYGIHNGVRLENGKYPTLSLFL